jgi:hypothetical protein
MARKKDDKFPVDNELAALYQPGGGTYYDKLQGAAPIIAKTQDQLAALSVYLQLLDRVISGIEFQEFSSPADFDNHPITHFKKLRHETQTKIEGLSAEQRRRSRHDDYQKAATPKDSDDRANQILQAMLAKKRPR